jgi:hypothetical protein
MKAEGKYFAAGDFPRSKAVQPSAKYSLLTLAKHHLLKWT